MQPKCSIFAAATLTLVLTGAAFAQTAPSGPAAEVLTSYNRLKGNIIKAAEKMPADSYEYKITPDIRTYARVVNHVTEAQFHTCTTLNGKKFEASMVPSDTAGKDAVVAGLKASYAECDKAYEGLTDAALTETVQAGPTKRSKIGMAWGNVSHDNEQYAILSIYLRLKGIMPPTVEK
ncbi:DinB family protein [Granulicella sibirica]|uniref:DinB-like domain-containing protein n=1 Tax=Granulicella sibirica TaxID=2479048 RepID=A0A4V1L5S0_9BACT|nr:DinB family protein [Granulicella sibirica]RXH56734.1 hypothetical protein GRAN_0044 [Granulicella sibirica]